MVLLFYTAALNSCHSISALCAGPWASIKVWGAKYVSGGQVFCFCYIQPFKDRKATIVPVTLTSHSLPTD